MVSDGRGVSGSSTSPPCSEYHHQHSYQQTTYKQPPHSHHSHHPPPPSPPSSLSSTTSSKGCCNLRRRICCNNGSTRQRRRVGSSWCCCCFCHSSVPSTAFTSLGVCVLVLGYTFLGAFTFMALEGGLKDTPNLSSSNVGTSSSGRPSTSSSPSSNSKPASDRSLVLGEEIRSKTVEKLWSITEDLNILYKENWTRLAAQEVLKFQDNLVRNLKGYGSGGVIVKTAGGAGNGGSIYYSHHHHRWSFSSSFLYSLTLITTIGYGSVAPRTPWGKVMTIIYALIGIPLMLVYLSTVGDVLARNFRRLYGRMCGNNNSSAGGCNSRNSSKNSSGPGGKSKIPGAEGYLSTGYTPSGAAKAHNSITADGSALKMHHYHPQATAGPDRGDDIHSKLDRSSNVLVLDCGGDGIGASSASSSTALEPGGKPHRHCDAERVRIPISLCLLIIIMYICGGAFLFNRLENWTFLEGSYFCFTSLGTIGFGDLIPGLYHNYQVQYQPSATHSSAEQLSVLASSAYILIGMALIAMCFNLVQDEVVIIVRRLGHYFGVAGSGMSGSSSARGGDTDDENIMIDVVDGEGIAMAVVSSSTTAS